MATNYLDIGPLQTGTQDIGPVQHQFLVTSTQTISAKARIGASSTQTITAKARIGATTTQTIPAKGRIEATSTQTLTAKARIGQTSSQTIPVKARIGALATKTITAKAAIDEISVQTITAKALITLTSNQTITARARLAQTDTRTITARAKIVPVISTCQTFEAFPFGAFTAPPPTNFYTIGTPVITSGGPDGSTRYLQFLNTGLVFAPLFYMSGVTLTFNYQVIPGNGFPDSGPAFIFRDTDGVNAHHVPEVHVLSDGTLAVRFPDGSYPGFSVNAIHQGRWYWWQINTRLLLVYNLLLTRYEAWIEFSLFLDNEIVIPSFLAFSGLLPSQLFGFGFNEIVFQSPGAFVGSGIDNLCIRSYTPSIIYPSPGTPNARIAQGFIEVAEVPSTSNVRVAQGFIEVPEMPSTSNVRIAHAFIELLTLPTIVPPPPPPDVPTPFLGRPSCAPQIVLTPIPTVIPVEGQPSPPVPPGPPTRTCVPQVIGQA